MTHPPATAPTPCPSIAKAPLAAHLTSSAAAANSRPEGAPRDAQRPKSAPRDSAHPPKAGRPHPASGWMSRRRPSRRPPVARSRTASVRPNRSPSPSRTPSAMTLPTGHRTHSPANAAKAPLTTRLASGAIVPKAPLAARLTSDAAVTKAPLTTRSVPRAPLAAPAHRTPVDRRPDDPRGSAWLAGNPRPFSAVNQPSTDQLLGACRCRWGSWTGRLMCRDQRMRHSPQLAAPKRANQTAVVHSDRLVNRWETMRVSPSAAPGGAFDHRRDLRSFSRVGTTSLAWGTSLRVQSVPLTDRDR
jgi:hypothetical protein